MKKNISILFTLILMAFGQHIFANPTHDTITMGPGYADDVFYSLSNGVIKTETRANWDLGFYTNRWSAGIIINEGIGVQLYTYPNGDTTSWSSIDSTGMSFWTPMHNSDTIWEDGAFNRHALGHPDYGWGVYNMISHDVVGDSIYIIKLANGQAKKLWIQRKNSVTNTFYFKYADLDGGNEINEVLDVTPYQDNRMFIYYNIQMQLVVDREPDINDWDLQWSRYAGIVYDLNGDPSYYVVVGVLSNLDVSVSKHHPVAPGFENWYDKPFDDYKTPIGHNWKEFNMSQFQWVIEDSLVYFINDRQGDIYKLTFDYFSGTGSGKTGLVKKLLSLVDQTELSAATGFQIYPNPATEKINFNLDGLDQAANLRIYDVSGRLVHELHIQQSQTFSLDLHSYQKGIYIAELEVNSKIERQKFIIR